MTNFVLLCYMYPSAAASKYYLDSYVLHSKWGLWQVVTDMFLRPYRLTAQDLWLGDILYLYWSLFLLYPLQGTKLNKPTCKVGLFWSTETWLSNGDRRCNRFHCRSYTETRVVAWLSNGDRRCNGFHCRPFHFHEQVVHALLCYQAVWCGTG